MTVYYYNPENHTVTETTDLEIPSNCQNLTELEYNLLRLRTKYRISVFYSAIYKVAKIVREQRCQS